MRWLFVGVVVLNALYFTWSFATRSEQAEGHEGVAFGGSAFPAELKLLDSAGGPDASTLATPLFPVPVGCPAVGPFSAENDASNVARSLTAEGVKSATVRGDGEFAPVYWVYLPPLGSRQQALRKLRELQAAGVDSFIVSDGADANAISLGSFSVRDSAIGLQSRLRSAGYAAQLREQSKAVSRFWVVLADPDSQGFLEFLPRSMHAALRTERRPCPKGL